MSEFDPNLKASSNAGIFGLPVSKEAAQLVYLCVPWDVTASYKGGTADGPNAILKASHQVDLFDRAFGRPYEAGLYMQPPSEKIHSINNKTRPLALDVIHAEKNTPDISTKIESVNQACTQMNTYVYEETSRFLDQRKIVGVVGGEHSVSFGAYRAVAEKFGSFGMVHFDAHLDTRKAYEGFTWSHASIMYNALTQIPQIEKLIQIGIRDFCEEEFEFCSSPDKRVEVLLDADLKKKIFEGATWNEVCLGMMNALPKQVWISFDIDALQHSYCPHTGTPVPGGLDYPEALFLIQKIAQSGRTILGFDLTEVAPSPDPNDEWDGNVGARLLYYLSGATLKSQGLC